MASNHEFTLIPPNMVSNSNEQSNSSSQGTNTGCGKGMTGFKILLPDNTLYDIQLPVNCTGNDCMDQICGILGIVEKDYFGLKFVDQASGYRIWVNRRLRMTTQLKSRPPHTLYFCVKFYTQPQYLLQASTIQHFFVDLKCQIRRGDIHVPNPKKAIIGAHIAQAEMGDIHESSTNIMVYPPYFPNWNSGISHIIRKEHTKLKGVARRDAQVLFIMIIYELENYGMTYVQAMVGGEKVRVAIGAKCIRILTLKWHIKSRINFSALTQVAFGNKFFSFIYCQRDEERNIVEKKITAYVYNHTLAKSLFRLVTEDQVFHYQNTVTPMVLNHADNRETVWKAFCRKVLKVKSEKKYYYDIQRTKKELYRHYWQVLNQVASDEEVVDPPEEPPVIYVNLPNNQEREAEEEEDVEKLKKKCEVWWGLSDSSTNLAKELLPKEFASSSPSREMCLLTDNTTTTTSRFEEKPDGATTSIELEGGVATTATSIAESEPEDDIETEQMITKKLSSEDDVSNSSQPLSKAQGRKMLRFLMKIQDEKLCNVCMDELISSVFCPCGHYVACERCAKKLDKCPVCRQPVGYVQFVYTK